MSDIPNPKEPETKAAEAAGKEVADDTSKAVESLAERLDALAKRVEHFISIRQSPKEDGGEGKATPPPTRAEKEATIAEQIRDEVGKLREAEKEEKGRGELIDKVKKLEDEVKKYEKQPELFGKVARFFFPVTKPPAAK